MEQNNELCVNILAYNSQEEKKTFKQEVGQGLWMVQYACYIRVCWVVELRLRNAAEIISIITIIIIVNLCSTQTV